MFILDCINACVTNNDEVLKGEALQNAKDIVNVLDVSFRLLKLVVYVVPVILVVFMMIDITKAVMAGEVDTKKITKSLVTRLTAAIIVFLVPVIVNFIMINIPVDTSDFINCYKCISSQNGEQPKDEKPKSDPLPGVNPLPKPENQLN